MSVCKASGWETALLMNRLSSYTKDKAANSPLRKSSSIETGELFVKLADQLPEGSLGHLSEEPGYDPACHLLQVQTQPVLPSPQIPGWGRGREQPTLWRLHTPSRLRKSPTWQKSREAGSMDTLACLHFSPKFFQEEGSKWWHVNDNEWWHVGWMGEREVSEASQSPAARASLRIRSTASWVTNSCN